MQLTAKQEQGLKIAVERYRSGEPWTCIAGYLSDKTCWTNLTKFIISFFNI